MNLQISSEIVCKANGRDFWLLAEKANKDKAKMKKPRPKTQEGSEEKGVEGKGKGKRDPTNRWLWPLSRNDLKIQDWEQELNFLSAFMCQVSWAPSTLAPSFSPLPRGVLLSTVSLCCTAIGNAYNDEKDDPWSFRFALLHSNHFQESTWLPPPSPPPLACIAERGWKNNFENLFSLILIRCKSFAFPLCAICVSDMDIAQRGRGIEERDEAQGVWQIITFSDLASSSLFNYLPRLVANFHLEQQPGEHN